ncbi:MAG: hypothetical protein SVT52_02755 [Planctomycetota bacterium]|nr:hypothetical protein [Planctomycetota bacterium]
MVRDALSGTGLPDYAKVVKELTGTLESTQTTLREISSLLKKLAGIPPAVAANRKAAMDSVGKCTAAAKAMAKTVADSAATQSADPADILKKFITQADRLAAQARRAGQMLDNVAGKENSTLVRNSRYWIVNRTELGELYRLVAAAVEQRARDAEAMLKAAKAEYQKKAIGQLRAEVAEFHKLLSQSQAAAETATTKLATVDAPMQAIFQQAGTGKLLGQLIESLAAQVKKIRELPKLDSETLASEITGDNIVIIEAAGKAEAVSFDEVWPLKVPRWSGPAGSEELRKRTFNGNAAIGSRILTMTNQPFATVLLCHYQPQVPPQMRRMIPPADISPQRLAGLRRRLEEANFKVGDWNLAAGPRPDAVEGRPQVLLILPPAASMPMPQAYGQQIPRFGPREVQTIRQAIDASTPAIFLTHFVWPRALGMFMPPTQPPYALGAYLSKDWGIDVQTHYRFIPAVVDESGPDRFKIDPIRFRYFPLSTFTDHPVGKPLQARRLMWNDLCPILHAGNSTGSGVKSPPVGVTIQSLLTVPAGLNATWATSDLQRLGQQLQARTGGFISPQADDLKPPLDVAVAATRAEGENVGPARIVVLTAAASLMDGYLEARIPQLDAKGAIALTDPPRANADVVVNSAYWLIGREGFIAAGPAQVRPVAIIAPAAMATLKILILIVLPLAVLALGGGVMLVRRR